MLKDIALLGAETLRTRVYLAALGAAGVMPAAVVLLRSKIRGAAHDIEQAATGSRLTVIAEDDVNALTVVKAIAALEQKYVIFSGPSGAIVRRPLFETGKRFLHVHPGRLPEFRGSTTIYYSLLKDGAVQASAIFLEERIDTGPIVGQASFPVPADRTEIDGSYDAQIRADLLVSVLLDYKKNGRFEETSQPMAHHSAYHIIHPVLKHMAILAK